MNTHLVPFLRRNGPLSHPSTDIITSVSILDSSSLALQGGCLTINEVAQPFFKNGKLIKKSTYEQLERHRISLKISDSQLIPANKANELKFKNLLKAKEKLQQYRIECWKKLKENFVKTYSFIKQK